MRNLRIPRDITTSHYTPGETVTFPKLLLTWGNRVDYGSGRVETFEGKCEGWRAVWVDPNRIVVEQLATDAMMTPCWLPDGIAPDSMFDALVNEKFDARGCHKLVMRYQNNRVDIPAGNYPIGRIFVTLSALSYYRDGYGDWVRDAEEERNADTVLLLWLAGVEVEVTEVKLP